MAVSRDDARTSFWEHPLRRTAAEALCFALIWIPIDGNSHERKAATIMVVAVWGALEVGAAYGAADLPNQFFYIRVFIGILIGRMWGIQFNNFAGVEFAYSDDGRNGSDGGGDGE